MATKLLNLRLRGTVYTFRRRVPDPLIERIGRKEIIRSLETSSRAEAGLRARAVWLATERMFCLVRSNETLERAQIDLILRRLVRESVWNSPTQAELLKEFTQKQDSAVDLLFSDEGCSAILALPKADRGTVLQHLERLLDRGAVPIHEKATRVAEIRADVAELRRLLAERREQDAQVVASAAKFMQLQERKRRAAAEEAAPAPDAPRQPRPPTALRGEPFAARQQEYLDSRRVRTDDFAALTANSLKQARQTFAVWHELIGDMAVGAVTKVETRRFRSILRTLPASYGKGAHAETPVTLNHEIERGRQRQIAIDKHNEALPPDAKRTPDVEMVSLKTVKRHFSAFSAYWQWLEFTGHAVEGSNPFLGFNWPGVRRGRKGRDAWSEEHLRALLASEWFMAGVERGTFWWITVIGMYSGLRLEEIARLRLGLDIRTLHGRLAFVIQKHFSIQKRVELWSPKTEAGERVVPVHPTLLELGFEAFVKRQQAAGHFRLFPDLEARGPEENYGPDFSRAFSKYKIALGIPRGTVFHSFRHSVRTILTNAPANLFRDAWIDAVVGHHVDDNRGPDNGAPGAQSVGLTIYLKEVDMQNLCAVVDYIHYPVEPLV